MIAGLTLGLGSVVSVGPNNLMLIREGLVRGRIWTVATAIFVSYLFFLSIACVASDLMILVTPTAQSSLTWFGLIALSYFSVLSFRAASIARSTDILNEQQKESWFDCLRRIFVTVWLNPLTYVEFLLIPAAICRTYTSNQSRLAFTSGLVSMAAASCYAYALSGGLLAPCMRHRKAMQLFDLTSGLLLGGVAMVIGIKLIYS